MYKQDSNKLSHATTTTTCDNKNIHTMMKGMSTRAPALEYAGDGIRINAVAPDKLMCLKKEQDENRTRKEEI
jgi:hypothetical protein